MSNDDAAFSPTASPARLAAWLLQARDGHRKGNLVEAQAWCQRILAIQPRQVEALNLLGMLLQQRGQSVEAEQTIRRAIRVAPAEAAAYASLGRILTTQHRDQEAIAAFAHAIRLRPGDWATRIALGDTFRALGRLPEAVAVWRHAGALRPADPDVYYRLGSALAELGRDAEAIVELTAASQACPTHDPAIQLLVTLLHRHGQIEEARNLIGAAVFRRGGTERALPLLEHWQRLQPDDPVTQHRLTAWFGQEVPVRAADAYVTDLFDRYADSFDQDLAGLGYRAPALIAELLAGNAGTPTGQWQVLDAGCGTGLCAQWLRPWARHLTGVDLSSGMVAKARERGGYDELVVAELTSFLSHQPATYDVIGSADTLVYFGDLAPVLAAAADALRPGGWLVFTVEQAEDEVAPAGFRLNQSGRYSHTADYVQQTLTTVGLPLRTMKAVTLRLDAGQPVAGYVVLAQRPEAGIATT